MPGFNGTGPRGTGAGSGRGLGPCGAGQGRGFFGRGFGRGVGQFFGGNSNSNVSKEDQLSGLEEEKKYLEEEINSLKDKK